MGNQHPVRFFQTDARRDRPNATPSSQKRAAKPESVRAGKQAGTDDASVRLVPTGRKARRAAWRDDWTRAASKQEPPVCGKNAQGAREGYADVLA